MLHAPFINTKNRNETIQRHFYLSSFFQIVCLIALKILVLIFLTSSFLNLLFFTLRCTTNFIKNFAEFMQGFTWTALTSELLFFCQVANWNLDEQNNRNSRKFKLEIANFLAKKGKAASGMHKIFIDMTSVSREVAKITQNSVDRILWRLKINSYKPSGMMFTRHVHSILYSMFSDQTFLWRSLPAKSDILAALFH